MSKTKKDENLIYEIYELWLEGLVSPRNIGDWKISKLEFQEMEKSFFVASQKGLPIISGNMNLIYFAAWISEKMNLKFESDTKDFFAFSPQDGIWKRIDEEIVITLIIEEIFWQGKIWRDERITQRATAVCGKNICNTMKGLEGCYVSEWISTNGCVPVENGIYNFETGTIEKYEKEKMLRRKIKKKFFPEAECPEFQNMLDMLFVPEDQELLQMYAGQIVYGKNFSSTILLLRGIGGTGKTTLVNIFSNLIGAENVFPLRLEAMDDRFEFSFYLGKSLLVGNDVPGNFLKHKNCGILKSLVGNDIIGVEKKNVKHTFHMRGEFNIIVVSNGRLHVALDADVEAWRRRIIVLDVAGGKIEKPIPNYAQYICEKEGEGILRWAIEGAENLFAQWKEKKEFPLSEEQKNRRDNLICESDSVGFFCEKMLECQASIQANTKLSYEVLRREYLDFCARKMWKPVYFSQLKTAMTETIYHMFQITMQNDYEGDYFSGLQIKNIEGEKK